MVAIFVPINECLQACWHFRRLKVTAPTNFIGDILGDIARPAFDGIEADDADRVVVLTVQEVGDHSLQVGCLDFSLAPGKPYYATPELGTIQTGQRSDIWR
jgi:hypothetical protein